MLLVRIEPCDHGYQQTTWYEFLSNDTNVEIFFVLLEIAQRSQYQDCRKGDSQSLGSAKSEKVRWRSKEARAPGRSRASMNGARQKFSLRKKDQMHNTCPMTTPKLSCNPYSKIPNCIWKLKDYQVRNRSHFCHGKGLFHLSQGMWWQDQWPTHQPH